MSICPPYPEEFLFWHLDIDLYLSYIGFAKTSFNKDIETYVTRIMMSFVI